MEIRGLKAECGYSPVYTFQTRPSLHFAGLVEQTWRYFWQSTFYFWSRFNACFGDKIYMFDCLHLCFCQIYTKNLNAILKMSSLMTKPTKWLVRPAKTQISLGIRPVWSESSLSAWRKLGSLATHWAHSEDPNQTGRMPRLIWVFPGCIVMFFSFVMMWFKCFVASSV